jgi:hypothetical protein
MGLEKRLDQLTEELSSTLQAVRLDLDRLKLTNRV